jgi:hypothetical protein
MKTLARKKTLALALVFAAATTFSGSAYAQYGYDNDDYYRDSVQQAHQYGFRTDIETGTAKVSTKGERTIQGI